MDSRCLIWRSPGRTGGVGLLLVLLLVACVSGGDTWRRIQQQAILRIGMDPTYPPFEMADGVPLQGLDVDLARAVAADLGLTAEFVYFGYDGLYDALLTGQVDVLLSALVVTPERTRDFAYSDPYFNAGQRLFLPLETGNVAAMADLGDRTLAVELGSQGHVEAVQWQRRLPDLAVLPLGSPDEALAAVSGGAADAALVDVVSGRLYLQAHLDAGLQAGSEPITDELYALVVRVDDEELLRRLNASLARLAQSGALDAIDARWLGP